MASPVISDDLEFFLLTKEFLYTATSHGEGRPNAAPKFLIAVENDEIFLADFVMGKACINLRNNPNISLGCMNTDTLMWYQLNGVGEVLEAGPESQALFEKLEKREIHFAANRVVSGSKEEKKTSLF